MPNDTTGSSDAPGGLVDLSFQQWAVAAELQLELIDKLGTFQKDVAEADLSEAQARYVNEQAEGLRAQVAAKWLLVGQLGLDLRDLRKAKATIQRHIAKLERNTPKLARMRNPERIRTSEVLRDMWYGYDFFKELASQKVLDGLTAMQVDAEARDKKAFVLLGKAPAPSHVPDDVTNVFQLIEWIREADYLPRTGYTAYHQITTAFSMLGGVPSEEIKKMREDLAGLDERFSDIWKGTELLGLPAKPPAEDKPSQNPDEEVKPGPT